MSVTFFTCKNCSEVKSEYDRIYCHECESELCSCAIPEELKKYVNIWEDVWEYVTTDNEDNFVASSDADEDLSELFSKYLTYDGCTYGLTLKKEYCPICALKEKYKDDPEYKEYLRLKKKFEGRD